jgi:hypothetical protein
MATGDVPDYFVEWLCESPPYIRLVSRPPGDNEKNCRESYLRKPVQYSTVSGELWVDAGEVD